MNFSASSAAMQPRAGGRYRPSICLVLHIASRENALDASARRIRGRGDIALVVHIDLALEQLGRRVVADGNNKPWTGRSDTVSVLTLRSFRPVTPSGSSSPTTSSTTVSQITSI